MSNGNYDNTNRGVLFGNDRKQQDNHPDFKGSLNVDGTEYWLSGWTKKSEETGKKRISLSVKMKDEQPDQRRPAATSKAAPQRNDDDFDGF